MKSLFLLCAIVAAAYFGWKHFDKPKQLEPREQVEAVLNKAVIPSTELAEICGRFPELCEQFLKNQKIQVSGVAKKILVKGVSSQDLSIELEGTSAHRISLTSDVNRAARMNQSAPEGRFKFEKSGREIIVYESATKIEAEPATEGEMSSPKQSKGARIFMRELETVTLEGVFRHMNKNAIVFEWRQPGHL